MKEIIGVLFVLAMIGIVIAVFISNYNECRSAGFSKLYCMTRHG